MSSTYLLEIECLKVATLVALGGLPVFESRDRAPRVTRRLVNCEILEGRNHLTVDVGRPSDDREDPDPDQDDPEPKEPPRLRVALYRAPALEQINPKYRALEVVWTPAQCALPATGRMPLVTHHFGGRAPAGGAPWRAADTIRPGDRSAFVGFLIELHQALGERNVERSLQLMAGITHGRAQADGVDGDMCAAALARELEAVFDDPAFAMVPLHIASLAADSARSGLLAIVRDERGLPPLRARQTRGEWSRTPVLSIVSGKVTMWS